MMDNFFGVSFPGLAPLKANLSWNMYVLWQRELSFGNE